MKKYVVDYLIKAIKSITVTADNEQDAKNKALEFAKVGYNNVLEIEIGSPFYSKKKTLYALISDFEKYVRDLSRNDLYVLTGIYIEEKRELLKELEKARQALIDFMMETNNTKD